MNTEDLNLIDYINPLENISIEDLSKVSKSINLNRTLRDLEIRSIENIKRIERLDKDREIRLEYERYLSTIKKSTNEMRVIEIDNPVNTSIKPIPEYSDFMSIIPEGGNLSTRFIDSKISESKVLENTISTPSTYIEFSRSLISNPDLNSIRFKGSILGSCNESLDSYIPLWEDMMRSRIEDKISELSIKDYELITEYIDMKNNLNFHSFCIENNLVEMDVISEFRNSICNKNISNKDNNTIEDYYLSNNKIDDMIVDYTNKLKVTMEQSKDSRLVRAKLDKLREIKSIGIIPDNLTEIINDIKLDKDDPINYVPSFNDYKNKKIKMLLRERPNNTRLLKLLNMDGDRILQMYYNLNTGRVLNNPEILDYFIETGSVIDSL